MGHIMWLRWEMLLINQEENYKPNTVQSLLAVALQSPLKCAQCLHSVCSGVGVLGNLAMQWFGHTGRVLSLPFCQVDCSNVLQQCRIPTMFSWSFDNNIAPCQVCCIIPLDNMLHTKYKAICQPSVLRLYCPSLKRMTAVWRLYFDPREYRGNDVKLRMACCLLLVHGHKLKFLYWKIHCY